MKPLIKWPGGKSGEIKQFVYLLPEFDRYIEPFVGGGALYFHINPEKAVINDISGNLMSFYRYVQAQDPEFHRILNLYCRAFGEIKEVCDRHYPELLELYRVYKLAAEHALDTKKLHLHRGLVDMLLEEMPSLKELAPDMESCRAVFENGVEDKFLRTVANDQKRPFSDADRKNNLITGFTGSFYLYFRGVHNEMEAGRMIATGQFAAATFYFVREYCYGSMFRYNSKGEFNIPYGGLSYNKKDLSGKVEEMFSAPVAALMERTELYSEDFEDLMGELDLNERDFIFLDPPYDSAFSEYEGHAFAAEDQRRLMLFLKDTPAKFLLVIKNTEYIQSLYEDQGFRILSFDNHYTYNVRSRNDRTAEHLIITNIPEGEVPWFRENI